MGKGAYRKGRKRPNDSGPGGYASRQKHANGEGDYPPEHVLENPAFETYYRESGIVPEGEWDAVWKPWPTRPASAAQAASGSNPRLAEAQGSLERGSGAESSLPSASRCPEPACCPRRWEDFMKTLRGAGRPCLARSIQLVQMERVLGPQRVLGRQDAPGAAR